MASTFVSVGDRVGVYGKPFTMEMCEGFGEVLLVFDQSDAESAYVAVRFDDEPSAIFHRWILPKHVEKKVD